MRAGPIERPCRRHVAEHAAAHDTALSALSAGQFFASYFGIDKAAWARQPIVRHLTCSGDCTAALLALLADDPEPSLVFVDGDLLLAGPAVLGSSARPVVIVVDGAVRFHGDVAVHGVLYGSGMTWNGVGWNAGIRGALIVDGTYQGDATPSSSTTRRCSPAEGHRHVHAGQRQLEGLLSPASPTAIGRQRGTTLLEALIAFLVLSLGILTIGRVQT